MLLRSACLRRISRSGRRIWNDEQSLRGEPTRDLTQFTTIQILILTFLSIFILAKAQHTTTLYFLAHFSVIGIYILTSYVLTTDFELVAHFKANNLRSGGGGWSCYSGLLLLFGLLSGGAAVPLQSGISAITTWLLEREYRSLKILVSILISMNVVAFIGHQSGWDH